MIPQLPWIRDELGLAESDVFAFSHLPYVKHRLLRLFRRIPPEQQMEKPMKT
jgi:hypothetical protein